MKNKWCNQWCPLPSVRMLDSRSLHPSLCLLAPSGLYGWGALSTCFLHHKINGNTHIQMPVQYQLFGKQGFPQRWSVYVSRVSHFVTDDETWNKKWKLCESAGQKHSPHSMNWTWYGNACNDRWFWTAPTWLTVINFCQNRTLLHVRLESRDSPLYKRRWLYHPGYRAINIQNIILLEGHVLTWIEQSEIIS